MSLSGVRCDTLDTFDDRTGRGKLRGLKVYASARRNTLTVEGNLRSFRFDTPNNLFAATPDDCRDAVEELSDVFGVSFRDIMVSRLDCAATFDVTYPCGYYTMSADNLPRHIRQLYGTTLYFKNGTRQVSIYDKAVELRGKKRKKDIPELNGRNILRLEIGYRSRRSVRQDFGNVEGQHLYRPEFFALVVRKFASIASRISFRRTILPTKQMTASRYVKFRLAEVIAEQGLNVELQRIEALRSCFSDKEYKRAQQALRDCYEQFSSGETGVEQDFQTGLRTALAAVSDYSHL